MSEDAAERVSIELTIEEAKLVITALRQFEPYWPADLDDRTRAELLADIRGAIDHIVGSLDSPP